MNKYTQEFLIAHEDDILNKVKSDGIDNIDGIIEIIEDIIFDINEEAKNLDIFTQHILDEAIGKIDVEGAASKIQSQK